MRLSSFIPNFIKRALVQENEVKSRRLEEFFFNSLGGGSVDPSGLYISEAGYRKNWVVYRAAKMVSEACASVPLAVYRKKRVGGKVEYELAPENHPFNKFVFDPNMDQGGYRFQTLLHTYMILTGNAYILPRYNNPSNNPTGKVVAYDIIRPDRVRIEEDSERRPVAYIETTPGGKLVTHTIQVGNRRKPLIHLTDIDPIDDHLGMSPAIPAADSIELSNNSANLNNSLLKNGSRMSGILSMEGVTDVADMQRFKTDFEKNLTGDMNAGKIAYLSKGHDFTPLGMTPKDGDYLEVTRDAARNIANALGVPPYLLGLKDTQSTFNNMREARTFLYMTTVTSRIQYMYGDMRSGVEGEVNRYLKRALDEPEYCIKPIWDEVEELSPLLAEKVAVANSLNGIATIEDQARISGVAIEPIPGVTDVPWRTSSESPVSMALQLPEEEEPEEEEREDGEKSDEFKLINDFTPDDRQEELRVFTVFSQHFEDTHGPRVGRELQRQINAAVKAYEDGKETDPAIDALMPKMEKLVERHIKNVMRFFGNRVLDAFDKSTVLTMEVKTVRSVFNAAIARFIKEFVADEVRKVSQTTKDDIKKQVLLGEQQGENRRQIAKRIAGLSAITSRRSKVIAQTETHAAANSAQAEAGIAATGEDWREWISAEDTRTRADHSAADGKRVKDGELFQVGGYGARYPGDPKLPAAQRINCRCTTGFIVDEG